MSERPAFFVMSLTEHDDRPDERARFGIQLLGETGLAIDRCFVDEHGALVGTCAFDLPAAVVRAALRQRAGKGDYVDAAGRSVPPF